MIGIIGIELIVFFILLANLIVPVYLFPAWLTTLGIFAGGGLALLLLVVWCVKHARKHDLLSKKHLAGGIVILLLLIGNVYLFTWVNTAYTADAAYGVLEKKIEKDGRYFLKFEDIGEMYECTEEVYNKAFEDREYDGEAYGIEKSKKYVIYELNECND